MTEHRFHIYRDTAGWWILFDRHLDTCLGMFRTQDRARAFLEVISGE